MPYYWKMSACAGWEKEGARLKWRGTEERELEADERVVERRL